MSFTEAVRSVYGNYAKFDGRASRPEYWWFFLFTMIVVFVVYAVGLTLYAATRSSAVFAVMGIALVIFVIISFVPSLAVGVRRLHDTDKSGWWYLLAFIPYLGGIILLILMALQGSPGYNRFGPPPGRSSAAQRAQYWGPSRPEALRKFADDAQRASASGYHPVWQEWRMGPMGEVLEVVYDVAPPQYGWASQPGYGQQMPYPQPGPTAFPPGGSWYQGGPTQPVPGSVGVPPYAPQPYAPQANQGQVDTDQPSAGPPPPPQQHDGR